MPIDISMEDGNIKGVRYAVDVVEDEISKEVGPIAKFIVNKCLVEMGKKRGDDFTFQELVEFITRVSKMSISDPKVQKGMVDHLTMRLEIKLNIDISNSE